MGLRVREVVRVPHGVIRGEVVGFGDSGVVGAIEVARLGGHAEAGERIQHALVVGEVDDAPEVDEEGVDLGPVEVCAAAHLGSHGTRNATGAGKPD